MVGGGDMWGGDVGGVGTSSYFKHDLSSSIMELETRGAALHAGDIERPTIYEFQYTWHIQPSRSNIDSQVQRTLER